MEAPQCRVGPRMSGHASGELHPPYSDGPSRPGMQDARVERARATLELLRLRRWHVRGWACHAPPAGHAAAARAAGTGDYDHKIAQLMLIPSRTAVGGGGCCILVTCGSILRGHAVHLRACHDGAQEARPAGGPPTGRLSSYLSQFCKLAYADFVIVWR
jgi:hypothetical protein